MQTQLRPGQIVKHFKKGLYQIVTIAQHSETGEKMVVYQALYPPFKNYVRPYESFVEKVDAQKYPDVRQAFRFQEVTDFNEIENLTHAENKNNKQESNKQEAKKEEMFEKNHELEVLNPVLMEFLEASSLHEKLHVLQLHRKNIDKNCIRDMAVSLDIIIEDNDLEKQYQELVGCINTMKRFEVGRLR